jgi:hypothetical protein
MMENQVNWERGRRIQQMEVDARPMLGDLRYHQHIQNTL